MSFADYCESCEWCAMFPSCYPEYLDMIDYDAHVAEAMKATGDVCGILS